MRVLCTLFLLLLLAACGNDSPLPLKASFEVHAHRGGRAIRPENTLVAFETAISQVGADAVELDLRQTADQIVIVNHDIEVNPKLCVQGDGAQITNRMVISQTRFEDIRKLE